MATLTFCADDYCREDALNVSRKSSDHEINTLDRTNFVMMTIMYVMRLESHSTAFKSVFLDIIISASGDASESVCEFMIADGRGLSALNSLNFWQLIDCWQILDIHSLDIMLNICVSLYKLIEAGLFMSKAVYV